MEEPQPPVCFHQVLDSEALAAAIRDANLAPCQLSVRPSLSKMTRVNCPNVSIDYASLGPAMLFSGSMPKHCYTLVFVTRCEQKGRAFNFSIEHNDGYLGFFPPGGLVDAYTPEGYENASLTVPAKVFLDAVERCFPEIPESILNCGAGIRIGSEEQAQLRGLLRAVMASIEDPSQPLALVAARRQLESGLLDAFLTALCGGCGSFLPRAGTRMQGRLSRLRQARDYLTGLYHQPLSLADLCSELGMSRRGVELLFQETLGIGPNAFIRHQRLHGVRRTLRASQATPGVVKQTAFEWGFWHLGHFSHEYQALFGESPRTTLLRHAKL